MLRPVDTFMKNIVGDIMYRRNLNIGIVKVVNADKSFNVEISESGKIHKNVFTLSPDPDLAVDDKVRILYNGGNIDDPILLAPTKLTPVSVTPIIAVILRQYSEDNYLKFYSIAGTLLSSHSLGNVYYPDDGNGMTIDVNNNVYYIKNSNYLTKVNSSGEELLSVAIAGYPEAIAIGADGYLYTREQTGKLHKRDISTFASLGFITVSDDCGLVLDSSGNAYVVNTSTNKIEKWNPAGVKTGEQSINNENNSCLGISSNYIIRSTSIGVGFSYKMSILLGAESEIAMTNIDWQHGCSGRSGNLFFVGENNVDFNLYLEKYSEAGVLDWSICADNSEHSPDYGMVAVYPF